MTSPLPQPVVQAGQQTTANEGERYRVYEPGELGKDGYPPVWHEVKHEVRAAAGHRCVRCGHPYKNGEHGTGEWTPCDPSCTHEGPIRVGRDRRELAEPPQGHSQRPRDYLCRNFIEAQWRILTVHHLDGNKANLRWWNLAALCQRCHLTIQGRVQMARVWPWEHSEWFRPYVAGYYAAVYLGQDLPRSEVEARLEELLALERAA